MRKITILMTFAVALGLASCTAQAPKADLKSQEDTLAYSIGVAQTQGLKDYLIGRVGVDSTDLDQFVKGVIEGSSKTSKKEIAYLTGLQIGQQISSQMLTGINTELYGPDSHEGLSKENLMAGFLDGFNDNKSIMSLEEAQSYAQLNYEKIKEDIVEKKFADNKAEGEKFLADNKAKEGVVTTESGLQYKIITEGKGEIPTEDVKVKVHYKGTLIDGTEFDSSYEREEPSEFSPNQVIAGWKEALTLMPVGSKWELYIPQELAYGSRESGKIPPYSALIFEVELLGIEK
ncbi:MAG: FKBP-type peptidyl-prolyl cis-trans isomerase [Bacteroidales bacterium]|nr:FKBP-type peptidyl-prolyl cis-trans isomerase [Bacteroidales bacterium]